MLAGDVLRDARRRRGLSLRAAAQRCDVPRGTWAGWESGRTSPTAQRLDEVLRALLLDLRLVDVAPEPPGQALVGRHLRRSLTVRAQAALGEHWSATVRACRDSPRLLTGPAAVGVWVPHVVARGPLPLPVVPPDCSLVHLCLDAGRGQSPVRAAVPTPSALMSQGYGEQWPMLPTAERLITAQAPRDAGGRRLPPHRDPDERREIDDLSGTLTWGGLVRQSVSELDSRAWRLDAPATLDEALTRQGLPARDASRRRRRR